MHILNSKRLMPGDIIFTRDKWDPTSISIRTASLSRFSHAILCVDAYSYIDSDMEGVHANNPQYKLFPNANDVAVKRYREPLSEESLHTICDYARSEIGKRYSVSAAIGSVTWFASGDSKAVSRQFCSRLVAMSYAAAGIKLVRNPLRCTPNRIYGSVDLIAVPDVCRVASEEDLVLAKRHSTSMLPKQEEITNKLLADVRAATKSSVETITDMVNLVIERSETDVTVLSILDASGYLIMWMDMCAKFPHWYDAEVYAQTVPIERQAEIADELYESVLDALRRDRITHATLSEAFSYYQRQTIAMLLQLEVKLYELDEKRLAVVEQFRTKKP